MNHRIDTSLVNKSEIARRMGVSPAYICMLLSGKRKSESKLKAIKAIIKHQAA